MPKGQQRKIKGAICNVPVECDKTFQTLPRAPESSGMILLKLKCKLQFRGHVYYQAVRPEVLLYALNWLVANNELYKTIPQTWINWTEILQIYNTSAISECTINTTAQPVSDQNIIRDENISEQINEPENE